MSVFPQGGSMCVKKKIQYLPDSVCVLVDLTRK